MSTPIIIERVFESPISKVWSALTNRDEMKNWYFDLAEFKPEIGFKFQFVGGPSPDKQYKHLCEVTEVLHEKKLIYSWKYDRYSGESFVKFELSQIENSTLLKLTHTGIETFPKDNKDFDFKNFNEGWNFIIHTSLKKYLEI